MTEKRTRDRFRGDLWLEQQADQRVKAALRQKQEDLTFLRRCAEGLDHENIPQTAVEIDAENNLI